jgi:hypothetical protein
MSLRIRLAGAVAVALGAAASAQAAPPWSVPVRIGPAGAEVISVGFGSTGRGLVALSTPTTSMPIAVPVGADGRPETPYRLLRGGTIDGPASGGLVVYGKDRVIAAGGEAWPNTRVWAAVGRIGRSLTKRRVLAIPRADRCGALSTALAANQRGDAAVAATGCTSSGQTPLYLAIRRAGHAFSRPVRIAATVQVANPDGGGTNAELAVGPQGDVLVAWASPSRASVWARRAPVGRPPAAAQRLGPIANNGSISVAVGARGRAAVAWESQAGDWGGAGNGPSGPVRDRLSTSAGHGRFTAGRLIDMGALVPDAMPGGSHYAPWRPAIAVTIPPTGHLRVAWTAAVGDREAARVLSGGRMQTLGEGTAVALGDLVSGPHGEAIAVWWADGALLSSSAAPGGGFDPNPVEIATGHAQPLSAAAAFDARTDRVLAGGRSGAVRAMR